MNDIIKAIEAGQMKESVDAFRVGDTVKVYNKIKEGSRERLRDRTAEQRKPSQSGRIPTASVLRRPGRYILPS